MARRGLPKNPTEWFAQDRKLTTFRPGNLEDQPDEDRDETFSDPTPYFSLKTNFGLNEDEYTQYQKAQRRPFRPIPEGPDQNVARRTRGRAMQGEDVKDYAGIVPTQLVAGRSKKRRS